MPAPTDTEIYNAIDRVVTRLQGTFDDIEEVMTDLADEKVIPFFYNEAPKRFFAGVDARIWPCTECNYWTPTGELKDETCTSCRPAGL